MMVVLLLGLPGLLGIYLLLRGWHGRRVGDHPHCRRCGFDLVGLPEGSLACSECGADVRGSDAVVIGQRQRRMGLVLAGAVLVAVPAAGLGLWGWGIGRNVNWMALKPVWWLRQEARSTTPAVRDPALAELLARIGAGALPDSAIASLVEDALEVQADRSLAWVAQWGDLVEAAHIAGKVPAGTWQRYAAGAVAGLFTLEVRPQVRRGERVPIRLNHASARVGLAARLWADCERGEIRLDGQPVKQRTDDTWGTSLAASSAGASSWSIEIPKAQLHALGGGRHALSLQMKMRVKPTYESKESITEAVVDLRADWALVPAQSQTVAVVKDESLRPAVEKSLKVERCSYQPEYLNLVLNVDRPPVSLAYEVWLRAGGKEWSLGSITVLRGRSCSYGTGGATPGLKAERGDLVLRPSQRVALETVDMQELWDGEVVIKDVKLIAKPATQAGR